MMKVLSDIYPSDTKPERPGMYLAGPHVFALSLRMFIGTKWCHWPAIECANQALAWRGLAFDPAAASVTSPTGVWIPGATCE